MKDLNHFKRLITEDTDSNLSTLDQLTITKTDERGKKKTTVYTAKNGKTVEEKGLEDNNTASTEKTKIEIDKDKKKEKGIKSKKEDE